MPGRRNSEIHRQRHWREKFGPPPPSERRRRGRLDRWDEGDERERSAGALRHSDRRAGAGATWSDVHTQLALAHSEGGVPVGGGGGGCFSHRTPPLTMGHHSEESE